MSSTAGPGRLSESGTFDPAKWSVGMTQWMSRAGGRQLVHITHCSRCSPGAVWRDCPPIYTQRMAGARQTLPP